MSLSVMSSMVDEDRRAAVIGRISKGLKNQTICAADILALATESAAKKRLQNQNNLVAAVEIVSSSKRFQREICDPSSKENEVPKLNSFPISPYRAMESFYLKKSERSPMEDAASLDLVSAIQVEDGRLEEVEMNTSSPDVHSMEIHHYNDSADDSIENRVSSLEETTTLNHLRSLLISQLLRTLNHGTYEELISLEGIGKVRAMKIFTKRNAGATFQSLDDLQTIGLNKKSIEKFMKQNLGAMVC